MGKNNNKKTDTSRNTNGGTAIRRSPASSAQFNQKNGSAFNTRQIQTKPDERRTNVKYKIIKIQYVQKNYSANKSGEIKTDYGKNNSDIRLTASNAKDNVKSKDGKKKSYQQKAAALTERMKNNINTSDSRSDEKKDNLKKAAAKQEFHKNSVSEKAVERADTLRQRMYDNVARSEKADQTAQVSSVEDIKPPRSKEVNNAYKKAYKMKQARDTYKSKIGEKSNALKLADKMENISKDVSEIKKASEKDSVGESAAALAAVPAALAGKKIAEYAGKKIIESAAEQAKRNAAKKQFKKDSVSEKNTKRAEIAERAAELQQRMVDNVTNPIKNTDSPSGKKQGNEELNIENTDKSQEKKQKKDVKKDNKSAAQTAETVMNKIQGAAEIAARLSASSNCDNVGAAAADTVTAVPKYVVEKKAEKIARNTIQKIHDRSAEKKYEKYKEKLKNQAEKAKKLKTEKAKRQAKANVFKSAHGIQSQTATAVQNIKAAVKAAIEAMKAAARSAKTIALIAGSAPVILILILIIIIIFIIFSIIHPFGYITSVDESGNTKHEEMDEGDVIRHYHEVIDEIIAEANADIPVNDPNDPKFKNTGVIDPGKKAQYDYEYAEYQEKLDLYMNDVDAYAAANGGSLALPDMPEADYWFTEEQLYQMGAERGPIFEGYVWSDETDGTSIPFGKLYNECLAAIAAFNAKNLSDDETTESETPDNSPTESTETDVTEVTEEFSMPEFEYLDDNIVDSFYRRMNFWTFEMWDESVGCPSGGGCCTKIVRTSHYDEDGNLVDVTEEDVPYCPGHYVTVMELKFYFDMDETVFPKLNLGEEYMEVYEDGLEEIEKNL